MKKIMFNDRYGLTQAVLEGRKTMTRRIMKGVDIDKWLKQFDADVLLERFAKYKVGEVLAIAQSYSALNSQGYVAPEGLEHTCEDSAGYRNKMFVRADLMPHRIRITARRLEHLQYICENDCVREGIWWCHSAQAYYVNYNRSTGSRRWLNGKTAVEAFADLIEKIGGRGIWDENPWTVVYSFELVQ